MAFIKDISAYSATVTSRYGGISEKGALTGDSSQRNFVGGQMQWIKDNGLTLGDKEAQENFDKFMQLVNGKGSSQNGFTLGEGGLFWAGEKDQIGKDEFAALGNMMQQLQCMQQDGKITMEEYAAHMTTLFSTATLDSLENSGKGAFMNLAQNIEDLEDRPKDPEVAAQNAERMSIQTRPVINDLGDYRSAVTERRGNDAPVYNTVDEAKSAAYDAIKAARDAGQITSEQFDAMQDYIRNDMDQSYDPYSGMYTNNTSTVAYAIEDALATGDQSVIDKLMDPATLKGIQNGGIDGLSDLDLAARNVGVHSGTLDPEPETGTGKGKITWTDPMKNLSKEATATMAIVLSARKMESAGMFEKDPETGSYPGIDMIGDTMLCNYFDPQDGSEPPSMTAEEYFDALDRYENMPAADQMDFRNSNPDFMAIHNTVSQIDALTAAMTETLDGSGSFTELATTMKTMTSSEFAGLSLTDVSKAIRQVSTGEGRDLSEIMAETHSDELDHDAEMTQDDLDILQQKSPLDRFEDIKAATVAVWKGEYDNEPHRTQNLQAAGFSDDEIKRIQNIVDVSAKRGDLSFCSNLTVEQYDELYAEQDGGSLADRTAEFNARQLEAAGKMLTYEGGGDYMMAHNADGAGQMTREEADQLYADAAAIASAGEESGYVLEEEEAAGNLARYVSEGGEAAFEGDAKNAYEETQPENEGTEPTAGSDGMEMQ